MRKDIRLLPLVLLLFLPFQKAEAQKYPFWEAGLFAGFSTYQGELSAGLNETDFWKNAGGILVKYHFDRTIKLRAGVYAAQIHGDDAVSDFYWRKNRNLNFRTNIFEAQLAAEVHLFTGKIYNQGFHPYLFAGLAGFMFNPQGRLQNNEWLDLQPLGTEGQGTNYLRHRDKYSLISIAIPFGFGIEIDLGRNFSLGAEFGFRLTITDFLDDVSGYYPDIHEMEIAHGENSINQEMADRRLIEENYPIAEGFYRFQQRGDPSNKDSYVLFGFNITKKFTGMLCNSF